jgi:hypothetical protein
MDVILLESQHSMEIFVTQGKTRTKKQIPSSDKQQAAIHGLINGLNTLGIQAEAASMGTAARILFTAKEELVYWAVTMNFHETAQDRFINQNLYNLRLATVGTFIERVRMIKSTQTRSEIMGLLGMTVPEKAAETR